MTVNEIVETLGYRIVPDHRVLVDAEKIDLCYANNPDGTLRWLWPSTLRHPLFLKFYNVRGRKAKFFAWAVTLLFRLRVHRLMFRHICLHVLPTADAVTPVQGEWAAFAGTPGPNRKVLIYAKKNGAGFFIKQAVGENAMAVLANEHAALCWLRSQQPKTFQFPEVIQVSEGRVKISDVATNGQRTSAFSAAHVEVLKELKYKSWQHARLCQVASWQDTNNTFAQLCRNTDPRLPKGMLRKIGFLLESINDEKVIETCFAHGDFTPWNMFQADGKLCIYDWEMSQHAPLGFDAFHYIIQNGILVARHPWRKIEADLQVLFANERAFLGMHTAVEQSFYLSLYLLMHTVYYLDLYSRQNQWHTQVRWLLDTWSEAISAVLAKHIPHRELLLMDVVDVLRDENYAVLKYDDTYPEHLSPFSDLDVCITREGYKKAEHFLANHALVRSRQVVTKSFMATEHLILHDGSMLSLDFIWELKRKALVMMDIDTLLRHAQVRWHGVKTPATLDDAQYVALFYSLNHAPVPARYQNIRSVLQLASGPTHALLAHYVAEPSAASGANIRQHVKARPENKGICHGLHQLQYALDVVRAAILKRGIVITFSGVDGAGKSTIIENVKHRVEKQLRRRVVVLRHRPSLLPILSVWTKGKAAAEKAAATGLPRQGNNRSTLSSMFRFAYYYTDYLIGQLYIHVRYVLRGYVVLYDRYYFDFINDGRRSNIHLPAFVARWGFTLILKPQLNFFLYANADLILQRKKELDKTTIENLTRSYLTLFQKLNDDGDDDRYVPIENVDMGATLNIILNRIVPFVHTS
ncbi:phosphotransferase [Chryseolinea lacunae]|uniref:Phosphotransferase n=1 Tax=Chryseolinea lacunae TaxID=2801331 RepID=A0ABS1L2D4_9BACT|nr:phosphotransferase [Chryseolinea lacunae]MBL0745841.1 phosphotransferase [Chryseolinea lacunae]